MNYRALIISLALAVDLSSFATGCVVAATEDPAADSVDVSAAEGSGEHALSWARSKRDYCCLTMTDVGLVASCRNIRNYRDEVGRLLALNNCQTDMWGDWTTHKMVSAKCTDRPECPPPPVSPPGPPRCENGEVENATWTEWNNGSHCDSSNYVCRGGVIYLTGTNHTTNCDE